MVVGVMGSRRLEEGDYEGGMWGRSARISKMTI